MKMLLSFILVSSASFTANAGGWKGYSFPSIMLTKNYQSDFKTLPLTGNIEDGKLAWSGDYWATQKGGINYRWNAPVPVGFNYTSPTKEQFFKMTKEEIATLSPSEKFDLLNGFYDYPLKKIVDKASKSSAPDWAGICHGWAPATLHHAEPYAKVVTSVDGIEIPFGSADIKAILSYYYANIQVRKTSQTGLRCFNNIGLGRGCKNDLNAGAFHLIMANRLGVRKIGFLADIERYKEVWNQPIVGYESTIVDNNLPVQGGAHKTAVKEVRVHTNLKYIDEADATWGTNLGTDIQKADILKLKYRLELNAKNEIVGGDWESFARPDFLWSVPKEEAFTAPYGRIAELLND